MGKIKKSSANHYYCRGTHTHTVERHAATGDTKEGHTTPERDTYTHTHMQRDTYTHTHMHT